MDLVDKNEETAGVGCLKGRFLRTRRLFKGVEVVGVEGDPVDSMHGGFRMKSLRKSKCLYICIRQPSRMRESVSR